MIVPDEALAMTTIFIRIEKEQGFMKDQADMFVDGRLTHLHLHGAEPANGPG